jgi:hypothetical protein
MQERALEYALAGWLLVSDGRDFFGTEVGAAPGDFWNGFDIDLGTALGDRKYDEDTGLYTREFERGIVLLREPLPIDDTLFVDLGEPYIDPQGEIVWSVELGPRSGTVLRRLLAADSEASNR